MATTPDEWFDQLVMDNRGPLLSFCFALCGPAHSQHADDVFQEVLALAWRKRAQLIMYKNPPGWLYGAAKNFTKQVHERERKQSARRVDVRPPQSLEDVAGATVEELVDLIHDPRALDPLHRLISRLPEMDQEIIRLKARKLSNAEIAQLLGTSESNVKVRMSRTHAHLRSAVARR